MLAVAANGVKGMHKNKKRPKPGSTIVPGLPRPGPVGPAIAPPLLATAACLDSGQEVVCETEDGFEKVRES